MRNAETAYQALLATRLEVLSPRKADLDSQVGSKLEVVNVAPAAAA